MSFVRSLSGNGAVHAAVAFLAMGGWALFANRTHPMPQPLISGLVQGLFSACLTLFLKSTIEILSKRFSGLFALVLPPFIACTGSAAALVTAHSLSGTPELLNTIALPLAVSTSYAALYSYSIHIKRKNNP
ncbi:hypothetical protein [Pararhizobium gei]|uniref:hypothetical protein n=1 Tax=Pararhizobium gei TaxID=1395951 RepID=UPI0023DA12F8|nr:hypothetical protein [Rhizobium gei]